MPPDDWLLSLKSEGGNEDMAKLTFDTHAMPLSGRARSNIPKREAIIGTGIAGVSRGMGIQGVLRIAEPDC
jgi:hypothetical protein